MKTSTLRNGTEDQSVFTTTSDYENQLPSVEEVRGDFLFYTVYRKREIEKALEVESDLEVCHFLRQELAIIAQA